MRKSKAALTATGLLIILLGLGLIFWKNGSRSTGSSATKTETTTRHSPAIKEADGPSEKPLKGEKLSQNLRANTEDPLKEEAESLPEGVRAFGGVYLHENKKSVPGAKVYLLGSDTKGKKFKPQTLIVEQNGSFEFKDLEEGNYRVYAKAKGLISHSLRKNVTRFTVDNETQSIGPLSLFLEKAQVLQVHISTAATGEPVPGAQVKILSQFEENHTADSYGVAEIYLTAEIWNMEVSAQGFGKVKKAVDLWANPVTKIAVGLEPGGSVDGKAVDEEGKPLTDIRISLNQSPLREHEKTDSQGFFQFKHLNLKTPFSLAGYQKGYQSTRLTDQQFEPDQTYKSYTLVMREPDPVKDPLTLKVRVTNKKGIPITKASVKCRTQGPMGKTSVKETNSDGFCFIEEIDKNSFSITVSASAEGFAPQSLRHRLGPESEQEVDITLEPARSISGTIYDGAGDPVEGVTIRSGSRFANEITPPKSDRDGSFALENQAQQGKLWFSKRGYSSQQLKYDEEDSHLEVVLKGLGTLHGQVVDENSGEPIQVFTVKLKKSKWDRGLWATQGIEFQSKNGNFRIPDLSLEKALTLTIKGEGYVVSAFENALPTEGPDPEPETYPLSKSGLNLSGTLVNGSGQVRAGIPIKIIGYPEGDRFLSRFSWRNIQYILDRGNTYFQNTAITDAQGRFQFQGLPEDLKINLLVTAKGLAKARMTDLQDLVEEERQAVLFQVEDEAILKGKINREVYPHGTQIQINGNGQHFSKSLQVVDTTFSMDQLPSGTFSVQLFTTSPRWKTIDSKEVILSEGDVTEVSFGFEEQFEVSGFAFVNGQPASGKSLFLMASNGTSGAWKKALADERGYFVFPENKPGQYDLILTRQAVPDYRMASVLKTVPNRHSLEVVDAKVEGDYHFNHFGTLTGRVVSEQKNLTLAILETSSDSVPYRAEASANLEGFFRIEQVPPGTFSLRVSGDFNGTDTLVPDLVMLDDGSDLDLGDLHHQREAKLQLVFHGDFHGLFRGFQIYFFDTGIADSEMSANSAKAQRWISTKQNQKLLEGLPTGPLQAILKTWEHGFAMNPSRALVTLDHDQPVQLQVEIFPVTTLVLSNRSKKEKFKSATVQQGDVVLLFNYRELFGFVREYQEKVPLLSPGYGIVQGLAEGRWKLSVLGTGGSTHEATVTLKKGRRVQQEINFQ